MKILEKGLLKFSKRLDWEEKKIEAEMFLDFSVHLKAIRKVFQNHI